MFEVKFQKLLTEYIDAIANRSRFVGLVKDYFPGQQMQINLIISAYDLGIAKDIDAVASINNAFAFRYVKRLMDEYGISRINADWTVATWCVCYGKNVLKKPCDIKLQEHHVAATPAIQKEKKGSVKYGELFTYEKLSDGVSYAVTGFTGENIKTLIFPNRYNNSPVVEIKAKAFSETAVQEAILTDAYVTICERAFQGCISLKQFVFPISLKTIGNYALSGCGNLSTAVLPQLLEQIGAYAFADTNLKNIVLPKSVYWIGEGAFSNCSGVTSISIPDNINEIPKKAFLGCINLKKVEFHENLQMIGESAFEGCSSLENVYVPDSVISIGENAFKDTHEKFILMCSFGSYAEEYARNNKLKYQLV